MRHVLALWGKMLLAFSEEAVSAQLEAADFWRMVVVSGYLLAILVEAQFALEKAVCSGAA